MNIDWPREFPGAHWLDQEEEQAVVDVVRKGTLFRFYGMEKPRYVEALEAAAREYYGARHALAVNSGTGALMTAMNALGIGPGREVIIPSFLWVATVSAVVQANAIPVLCEVDDSYTMDPEDLERKITPRTGLIVAVHMAGAVCDMKAILAVAERHGIPILEDCAQANGGTFQGKKAGTFGRLGMYSFQINKNATAGEGGLLVTGDPELYERCLSVHDLGVPWVGGAPQETGTPAITWGLGRRMSELCGAVASVQIRKLPEIIEHMRTSKRRMKDLLKGTPGLSFRRLNDEGGDTGAFLVFLVENAAKATQVVELLKKSGLHSAARVADYGLHIYSNILALVNKTPLSPAGNPWSLPQNRESAREYKKGSCPRSDDLFARSVILPVPSRLQPEAEEKAAEAIRAAVAGSGS